MDAWKQLNRTALVGTGHQPLPLLALDKQLSEAIERLPNQSGESQLLAIAAMLNNYQRAGASFPAEPSLTLPPSAPQETRPYLSGPAERRIAQLLEGDNRALLPEWLELVRQAGRLVPPRYIPALLAFGVTTEPSRSTICELVGQRGQWLARYNPQWDYLLLPVRQKPIGASEVTSPSITEAIDNVWQTDELKNRIDLLCSVRRDDPATGRTLLLSSWHKEPARNRKKFLAQLIDGLSLEDEVFLEQALDDRSREVRAAAAKLLARITGSALQQRMCDRSSGTVSVEKRWLTQHLRITPPNTIDDAARRDGVDLKHCPGLNDSPGERAGWLYQIIAATPLSFWTETLNSPVETTIALGLKSEWAAILIGGWAHAAVRQVDQSWLLALLKQAPKKAGFAQLDLIAPLTAREAYIIDQLKRLNKQQRISFGYNNLPQCQTPWSIALSRAVFSAFLRALPDLAPNDQYDVGQLLKWIGQNGDPTLYPAAVALIKPLLAVEQHNWHSSLTDCLTTYQFRHQMVKEIRQ